MKELYIFGAGGHAKVVAEVCEEMHYDILGFVVDASTSSEFLEYSLFNKSDVVTGNWIVAVGDNRARKRIAEELEGAFLKIRHPSANVSIRSILGEGSVVMAGSTINSGTIIGKHCIVNTNSSIDHDCLLEDFVHLSPNATLAGGVRVGEGTHIGVGVSVIPGISIGRWCTIGAGSVVIRDVPNGATVVGNPGKVIKTIEL